MVNPEEDLRYVNSCIEVFKQRVRGSVLSGDKIIEDFIDFVNRCKLEIVKKENKDGSTVD